MDRQAEAGVACELARREVVVGRKPGFGTCEIERNQPAIEIGDCRTDDFLRIRVVAESGRYAAQHDAGLTLCGSQTIEHRLDGGFPAQIVDHVQARTEADLGIDDTLRCEVHASFVGRSLDCGLGAHHCDGVLKRFEVSFE